MNKLGKRTILVTDISHQFWCERQMELNYLYGKKYTKAMEHGKKMHEALQAEVYVPLAIEPVTYEDSLYKIAYENYMSLRSLKSNGICREIRVYGSANGYRLSGQIDEMDLADDRVKIIEKKMTEAGRQMSEVYTRPHRIQIMLYRKIIGDIRSKRYTHDNFAKSYGVGKENLSEVFKRGLVAMGVRQELLNTYEMCKRMFGEIYTMPEINNRLEVSYVDRFSGKQISSVEVEYNDDEMNRHIVYAMKYWNGGRESEPVPEAEKWKCNFCKFFGNECKVWWKG